MFYLPRGEQAGWKKFILLIYLLLEFFYSYSQWQQSNKIAKMDSNFISQPALNTDKYNTWKKEMQVWELAISLDIQRCASFIFLSLDGKAKEAILE